MFSRLTNMEDRELCTFMAASQFLVFDLQVRFTVLGLIHFTGFWWKKFMWAYACTHKPVLFQDTHGEQDQLGTCSSDCRCIRGGAAVFTLKTSQRLLSSYNSSVSDPRQARIGFSGQALSGWRAWESRSEFKKDELLRTAVGFRLQLCRHMCGASICFDELQTVTKRRWHIFTIRLWYCMALMP